jgi:phospholipase/carboxylesterase
MDMPEVQIDGPRLLPAAGGPATSLVVLLHGLGADGNDLFALAPQLAKVLPGAAFVAPHAPDPCDMAPTGRQWFSFQDRSWDTVGDGMRRAWAILDAFLDTELEAAGLEDSRLALVGFSQGAMLAMHAGLRRASACAGIVAFSGVLVGGGSLAGEMTAKPPLLLVHGDADETVPVAAHYDAVSNLLTAGLSVESHIRPRLGHGIDEPGLTYCQEFLAKNLAGA